MKIWRSERAIFYQELVLSVLFLWFSFSVSDNFRTVNFHTFMRRDLDRALELLKGHLIFFGPEASGGGYLPGPFFYFMLAGALAFSPLWSSAFILLLNFFYATALGGWLWIKRQYNIVSALLLITALSFSHPVRGYVTLFLNVSYQLPFALFAVLCTCRAFSDGDAKWRDRYLLIAAGLIGLGLQLHFSIVCLLLSIVFLWISAPRLKLPRPSVRALGISVGLIGLTCLPYLIWRISGMSFGQGGSYIGKAPGSLPTLFMLANFAGQVPLSVTLREAALRVFAITPLSLIAALLVGGWRNADPTRAAHFRVLKWITFWSFFPFSYVFLVHLGRRYGMVYCFCLILINIELQFRVLRSRRATWLMTGVTLLIALAGTIYYASLPFSNLTELRDQLWLVVLGVPIVYHGVRQTYAHKYAVLVNIMATVFLFMVQFELGSPRGMRDKQVPRLHHQDWVRIWRGIYPATGWDYHEAMQRLYFVNLRLDEDPQPTYDDIVRENPKFQTGPKPAVPSGYFVINAKFLHQRRRDAVYQKFLLRQHLPEMIKDSLVNGDIELGEPLTRGTAVIPYYVRKGKNLPDYFHDVGEGYIRSASSRELDQVTEREGAREIGPDRWIFKWNGCPDQNPFCNVGAIISARREKPEQIRLTVSVVGSALAQNSPWISPSWTESWTDPYLEVQCGKQKYHYILFPSIGYSRAYGSNEYNELLQSNNSVVAPLRRDFELKCSEPIREMSVGRSGSVIEQLTQTLQLPAARLSLRVSRDESNVYK